jgi:quinolinate synthase
MAMNGLRKLAAVLGSVNEERGGNEIHIEESIRARARLSIQKMLDFAAAEKAGQIQLGD